jgi:hypothetical protein
MLREPASTVAQRAHALLHGPHTHTPPATTRRTQVSGNAEEVMTALKLVTDKLRCVPVPLDRHGQRVDGRDHFDRERGRRDDRGDKRTRGDDSGRYDPPPHAGVHAPLDQGGAAAMAAAAAAAAAAAGGAHMHHDPHGPPANALAVALPPHVRGVLDDNDSVKVEGLSGLATVEYRLLVPIKRSGVVLGHRGGVRVIMCAWRLRCV